MKPIALLPLLLAACATAPTVAPIAPTPMPGSDRDAHGCIGSAGYQWCARNQRCERPWELAKAAGIANTAQAVAAYCAAGNPPPRNIPNE
ncbi:hypothetical protein [Stenotrophomonas sp. 24(2023)]|uniref:hypothetical protein n=1 Tax=Stenotrophomonas sp. 24(2023) TaxID=3068324 RepID=UPI0027DF3578|nr:hypothetical protein [Stenotrophomonas sp. 24(2023)]WMJ69900.1 hypothetical protein Q9R17_01985 [Stenotrophomonas sp. 24(2023)]